MSIKLLVAATALALVSSAYALPPKPVKCPSEDAIRAGGLSKEVVEQDKDGTWLVALIKSKYDTKDSWSFVVGKIPATDRAEAYRKAVASLATVTFKQGPLPVTQIKRWACMYGTSQNYIAVAVTPDLTGGFVNALHAA